MTWDLSELDIVDVHAAVPTLAVSECDKYAVAALAFHGVQMHTRYLYELLVHSGGTVLPSMLCAKKVDSQHPTASHKTLSSLAVTDQHTRKNLAGFVFPHWRISFCTCQQHLHNSFAL
jgi:hypothetical protein